MLIGRAAHEVAHTSTALPLALAPLSAWPSASPSTASSALSAPLVARPPRGAAATASAARLRPLQDALAAVAHAAFDRWARWAAAGLAAAYVTAIATEPVLKVRRSAHRSQGLCGCTAVACITAVFQHCRVLGAFPSCKCRHPRLKAEDRGAHRSMRTSAVTPASKRRTEGLTAACVHRPSPPPQSGGQRGSTRHACIAPTASTSQPSGASQNTRCSAWCCRQRRSRGRGGGV